MFLALLVAVAAQSRKLVYDLTDLTEQGLGQRPPSSSTIPRPPALQPPPSHRDSVDYKSHVKGSPAVGLRRRSRWHTFEGVLFHATKLWDKKELLI